MDLKIMPVHEHFKMPTFGTSDSACFDVYAARLDYVLWEAKRLVIVHLGFKTEIPIGYKAVMVPRSSFTGTNWVVQNSPCQIDSDYRGEWQIRFKGLPSKVHFDGVEFAYTNFPFIVGDRIAQVYLERVIPVNFVLTDSLVDTVRGAGGFGHTGK